VQLFTHLVYPSAAPDRELHEEPRPRIFAHSPDVIEKSMYSLKDGGTFGGPYEWALDLCSVSLSNFNYRKMSLMRDYAALSDSPAPHPTFDALFSADARPVLADPPGIPIEERFEVMPADPTQSSAVARARRGESFIIQGPPGTGKSQTITNLVADYVARGKRVLFVCEKRAAIDVVYHRLRMQGLAPLTCLIHDSQTDKKAFIKDLKETYEGWVTRSPERVLDDARRASAANLGRVLGRASRFRTAMQGSPEGCELPIVSLLGRALDLADVPASGVPLERLPTHRQFLAGGSIASALEQGLRAVGRDGAFGRHPLRVLSDEILFADRPVHSAREEARALLVTLDTLLDSQLARVEEPPSTAALLARVRLVRSLRPLVAEGALRLLELSSDARRAFERTLADIAEFVERATKAAEAASGWRQPLQAADLQSALVLAKRFEGSLPYRLLGWLSPAWWRLRRLLKDSFDFASRALRPSWSEILTQLSARYAAEAEVAERRKGGQKQLGIADLDAVAGALAAVPTDAPELESFRGWLATPGASSDASALLRVADGAAELEARVARLLRAPGNLAPRALREAVASLQEPLADLDTFLEPLRKLASPEHAKLASLVRDFPVTVDQIERDVCRASADAGLRERALDLLAGVDWDALRAEAMTAGAEFRRANAAAVVERTRNVFLDHVRLSTAPADTLDKAQKQQKREYATGRKELEHELGKVTRYRSIRDLVAGGAGVVIRDLKPVWLMSPLSVADTLPLEASFDVVIFDEASQIPLEDAVPAAQRGAQVIVVGDQMQLPPSDFFAAARGPESSDDGPEQNGYELDSQSLLSHAERSLPSTMLGWHYRSRDESLIAFSNRVFYDGKLLTVPSVTRTVQRGPIVARTASDGVPGAEALLERAISYHRLEDSPYEQRRNSGEARYIAELLRALLRANTGKTIGVVAFSEAQQDEIESALRSLGALDPEFAARYEAEMEREEDGQHVGLFVKNLENVQGDERDIIVISVCYGPDPSGRMLMNFGPINKTGGEKRLNVIFSRAKHHLAVVSSIGWSSITNEYNDGANCLRNYLRYAQAMSQGGVAEASLALQGYGGQEAAGLEHRAGSLDERLARALRERGYEVELGVGTSQFRCSLGVRARGEPHYALGILLDDAVHQKRSVDELLQAQPSVLQSFGWRTITVLHKDWYADPDLVLKRIEAAMAN
jgi:AAA domain/REase_MTES_1575